MAKKPRCSGKKPSCGNTDRDFHYSVADVVEDVGRHVGVIALNTPSILREFDLSENESNIVGKLESASSSSSSTMRFSVSSVTLDQPIFSAHRLHVMFSILFIAINSFVVLFSSFILCYIRSCTFFVFVLTPRVTVRVRGTLSSSSTANFYC